MDYFSKVTTAGGTVIQGSPVTSSATSKSIPSKSSQSVSYYVNVGKSTSLNGVKISIFATQNRPLYSFLHLQVSLQLVRVILAALPKSSQKARKPYSGQMNPQTFMSWLRFGGENASPAF
ncbi:hypothetical protein [Paenibacillus pseudetheri]|uniref:hypothetical protein n=1 Tax=Paenibacillus pseudetheri TaxID=2897682 RepID=UPI001F3AD9C0|nr:hypothetical protein [Paenibacillus pseudetheri]